MHQFQISRETQYLATPADDNAYPLSRFQPLMRTK